MSDLRTFAEWLTTLPHSSDVNTRVVRHRLSGQFAVKMVAGDNTFMPDQRFDTPEEARDYMVRLMGQAGFDLTEKTDVEDSPGDRPAA